MPDKEVTDIIIRKLDRMDERYDRAEEKQAEQHEKLQNKIDEIREDQVRQSLSLAVFEKDIPMIKADLFVHIQGTVDNRHRITALEEVIKNQDVIITKAAEKYSQEIEPVIAHIKNLQELPKKAGKTLYTAAKIFAAIATLAGSIAATAGYFTDWFSK